GWGGQKRAIAEGVRRGVLHRRRRVAGGGGGGVDLGPSAAGGPGQVGRGRVEEHEMILLRDPGVMARRVAARDLDEPAAEGRFAVLELAREDLRDAGVVPVAEEVGGRLERDELAEVVEHRPRARAGAVGDLQEHGDRDPLDGGAEEGEDLRDAARASLQRRRRLEDDDPAREVDGRPDAVTVGGGGDLEELARIQVQLEDLPVPGALAAAVRAVRIEGDAVARPVDGGVVGIARPGRELHEKRMRWLRTGHLDGGDHPSLAVVVEEGEVVDLPPGAAVGEEVVGRGEDEAEGPRPRLGDEVWTAARQTDGRGALPMEREGRTGGQDRENDRETAPGGKQAYQGSRHATATKQEAYPGGRCPPPVTRAAKCPRMRCFAT